MVVRRWWLGFAISVEIHCVTAVAWCVSGVSNHDFPNFTKHSTVITSILQQISILYRHFPSAETALSALEQAKTMLKIALPTFKNDENNTQNSKIHTQNSGCEVRCGECGGGFLYFGCQGGEMVVRLRHVLSWLRRFLCVIQAFARFICGENAVRKRQNAVRKWQNCGSKTAKLWCIFGVYMLDFLHFGCQGGEMVVRLRRLVVWLLGFRVWFLYDLVVDAAFGNL